MSRSKQPTAAPGVVFPVVPRRGSAVRRLAFVVPALAAGAVGAAYFGTAPGALDLTSVVPLHAGATAPPVDSIAPASTRGAVAAADTARDAAADTPRARPSPPTVERPRPAAPQRASPAPHHTVTAPPPAAPPGTLSVSSSPWGTVVVDGAWVGTTPLINLLLPPGQHRVRIEHQGFESFDQIVTIRAGEPLRLTGLVLAPRVP